MKYKLLKDIIGAEKGMEFEYDKWWMELIKGKSLWNILDLIRAVWIDNKDYFEEVVEYDFSEFVGRYMNTLVIKWDTFLKSYADITIWYNNDDLQTYTDTLSYTETTLSKLEKWDVFVLWWAGDLEIHNIEIFMWKDNDWDYRTQYLTIDDGIELIESDYFDEDLEVIKVNRS